MPPQISEAENQLIADLHKLSAKAPKLVKSSIYSAPAAPDIKVRSWKMNEFKYYDVPSPFPTLARGLFSTEEAVEGGETKYRIVARGYDKFFNIGEVPWTTWDSLEAHTTPPYTLSLKSNGCIIFISALTPNKLLICSKHSIGPVQGSPESHAEAGERWLNKHLQDKGKTTEQLAATLWENNWTAIAELCDDSFEEHVLPYPPEKSGLHLHGINESAKGFNTILPAAVDAFAAEWGFISTVTTTIDSIAEVKSFTDEIGKTGKWNGEALEGFVVRTHVAKPSANRGDGKSPAKPPYAPGSSFFFKVKFDEPYMMYRDWREVTKTILSKGWQDAKIPKSKLKRPETKLYVKWVTAEIKKDKAEFDGYARGKGIIRTRERFLEWMVGEEGKKNLQDEVHRPTNVELTTDREKTFGKTIIVPVAIPGCGKTSVALALSHLFGFGHTQSDDVTAKKAGPIFVKNVVNLLNKHDVVIADKNNHLRQHRDALRVATANMRPPVRLFALNWSLDKPHATIHRICGDRVLRRGDKHQTLHADEVTKSHETVIWQFISNTEELADSEVDASVDMDLEDTPEQALDRAIDACVEVLGLTKPSQEKVQEALAYVQGYSPKIKKSNDKKNQKAASLRYFGLLPEFDLTETVGKRLEGAADVQESDQAFWKNLKGKGRIAKRPHVTIVHINSLPEETELWERCLALHSLANPPLFRFKFGAVVWNERVMALTVDDLQWETEENQGPEGQEFVSSLSNGIRGRLHMTVGTRDTHVPAVEAKALVETWRAGEIIDGVRYVPLEGQVVKGRIKGLFG